MFAQRLAGHSVAAIVRVLNDKGVFCPSDADPGRNRHRAGGAWQLRTVTAILANPRYTGRQVWNRQYTDHNPNDPKNQIRNGAKDVMRWNPPDRWVISNELAHVALVIEADFIAVQKVHVVPAPRYGTVRVYVLDGRIRCGLCSHKMDSHWVNGLPGYRCRHGHNSSKQSDPDRAKTLYLREDRVLIQLAELVAAQREHTWDEIEAMLRSGDLIVIAEPGSVRLAATEDHP